jgi:hypothetical protein
MGVWPEESGDNFLNGSTVIRQIMQQALCTRQVIS